MCSQRSAEKGKFDQRKFINKLISVTPNVRFDLYGMRCQPVWAIIIY